MENLEFNTSHFTNDLDLDLLGREFNSSDVEEEEEEEDEIEEEEEV